MSEQQEPTFEAQVKGQLDHIDTTLHEMGQRLAGVTKLIEEYRPLLDRAGKLLHNPVSEYMSQRRKGR